MYLDQPQHVLIHHRPCHHFGQVTYFQSLIGANLGLAPGEAPLFYRWWLHMVCTFVRSTWLPHSKWYRVIDAQHVKQRMAWWFPPPTVWWVWHYPQAIAREMMACGSTQAMGTFYVHSVTWSLWCCLVDWTSCLSISLNQLFKMNSFQNWSLKALLSSFGEKIVLSQI